MPDEVQKTQPSFLDYIKSVQGKSALVGTGIGAGLGAAISPFFSKGRFSPKTMLVLGALGAAIGGGAGALASQNFSQKKPLTGLQKGAINFRRFVQGLFSDPKQHQQAAKQAQGKGSQSIGYWTGRSLMTGLPYSGAGLAGTFTGLAGNTGLNIALKRMRDKYENKAYEAAVKQFGNAGAGKVGKAVRDHMKYAKGVPRGPFGAGSYLLAAILGTVAGNFAGRLFGANQLPWQKPQ